MYPKTLIIILLLSCSQWCYSNDPAVLDSLYQLLKTEQLNDEDANELISICIKYSRIDSEKANSFCEYVISNPIENIIQKTQAEAHLELGMNLNQQGQYDNALEHLNKGYDYATLLEDKDLIFDSYNKLGIYFNDRGENVVAIQNYLSALSIAAEMKDTMKMVRPYVNLTSTYLDQNRPEKSLEYGLKGLEFARSSNEERGTGFLLNNIAMAYLDQNNAQKAEPYLIEALSLNKKGNRPERVARNHSNLCKTYSSLGDFDRALENCEIADNILNEYGTPRSQMLHAIQYGGYFLAVKDYSKSLIEARKAIRLGSENGMTVQMAGAYELLYQLYKIEGNEKESLRAYEQYVDYKFGQENSKRNLQIASVEDQYLNALEEKKNIESAANLKILEKEKEISTTQRNFAILFTGGLIGLAFFLLKSNRNKNRRNSLLEEQNAKIETQKAIIQESLSEKETLLKEIHHRVKNNLQIISSLLNLQSKKITDESVLDSINEGKNRVEAMSLIHQNLYQSNNPTAIVMEDYFQQLMSHLASSFHQKEKKIEYAIDAKDIVFDIDTAIPIGLIANELISNSYKHAFINRTDGQIQLSLKEIQNEEYEFQVKDNGVGISELLDLNKTKSLGLKLVRSLGTKQLKGNFRIENGTGTKMILEFTHQKKQG